MRLKFAFFVSIILASQVAEATPTEVIIYSRVPEAAIYVQRSSEATNRGDYENAYRNLTAAIKTDPTMWGAYLGRAEALMRLHKCDLALQDLNTALRMRPSYYIIALSRGHAYRCLGRYRECLADYDKVLGFHPNVEIAALALSYRASLEATCPNSAFRNGKKAVVDATKSCELSSWKNGNYISTLAAACAESHDFDSAVRYQQQAIGMTKDPEDTKEWQSRIAVYRQHHALAEPKN